VPTTKSHAATGGAPPPATNPDPYPARTAQILTASPQLSAMFAVFTWLVQTLTVTTRKQVFKAKNGFETYAASLANLVKANPGQMLCPAGLNPQALIDGVAYVAAMEAFRAILQKELQVVEDELLVVRSEMYQETIDIYAINQRNARLNPSLTTDLAAFAAFQSQPHLTRAEKAARKAAKAGTTTNSAGGDTTSTPANPPTTVTAPVTAPSSSAVSTAPSVPLYGPNGPMGSVPPTNGK